MSSSSSTQPKRFPPELDINKFRRDARIRILLKKRKDKEEKRSIELKDKWDKMSKLVEEMKVPKECDKCWSDFPYYFNFCTTCGTKLTSD